MDYFLLKYFSKQKFLKDFLCGHLYMNTLSFFWDETMLEQAKLRRKSYISAHSGVDPDKVSVPIKRLPSMQEDLLEGVMGLSNNDEILGDFEGHNLSDVLLRSVGMGYCNTLCFYRLFFEPIVSFGNASMIHYMTTDAMEDFGEYVAYILDPKELVIRIERAVNRKGYQFLTGSVRYHELKKDGKRSVAYHQGNALVKADEVFDLKNEVDSITYRRDCFDKIDKYKGQNEWRMALYRGKKDTKAYTLDISDLHDIVYWDRAEYLDSGIQTAVGKGMKSVGSSEPRFYGNIDRKDLWNKFFELGDYKASKLIFIG